MEMSKLIQFLCESRLPGSHRPWKAAHKSLLRSLTLDTKISWLWWSRRGITGFDHFTVVTLLWMQIRWWAAGPSYLHTPCCCFYISDGTQCGLSPLGEQGETLPRIAGSLLKSDAPAIVRVFLLEQQPPGRPWCGVRAWCRPGADLEGSPAEVLFIRSVWRCFPRSAGSVIIHS